MTTIDRPIAFVHAKAAMGMKERLFLLGILICMMGPLVSLLIWSHAFEEPLHSPSNGIRPIALIVGVLTLSLASIGSLFLQASLWRSTVIFDQEGIRFVQGAPRGWTKLAFRPRGIRWDDLMSVSYFSTFGVVRFQAKGPFATPISLRARDWKLKDAWNNAEVPLAPDKSNADLMKVLRAHGILKDFPSNAALAGAEFDLMSHPASKAMLAIMAALTLYCFVDGFAHTESWVEFNLDYLRPHIYAGLAGIICAYLYLIRGTSQPPIPRAVAPVLALLFGIALAVTSDIAGLRINQGFAGALSEQTYYRSADCLALVPANKALPEIKYTKLANAYLCSLSAEEPVMVSIRQGFFGLYQVDLTKQTKAIRDYQKNH